MMYWSVFCMTTLEECDFDSTIGYLIMAPVRFPYWQNVIYGQATRDAWTCTIAVFRNTYFPATASLKLMICSSFIAFCTVTTSSLPVQIDKLIKIARMTRKREKGTFVIILWTISNHIKPVSICEALHSCIYKHVASYHRQNPFGS